MSTGLILIVIVAGAYLAAHFASEWMARRFLIVSGAEYLLLGVLLGPSVSGVIQTSTVDGFAPFLTLAFGWIGALIGAQFYVRDLIRVPAHHFRIATTEAALVLVASTGLMAAALSLWVGADWTSVMIPAVTFGAVATASAPTAIAVASRRLRARGFLVRQLGVSPAMDAVVSVTAFGILLALTHEAPATDVRSPTPTEWVVITVAIGVASGWLFHLFVGGERESDRLFIALSGTLILSSGAAAYLRLSPLLPALLVGLVLVNTSPARNEIRDVLSRFERPLYFVLLIFAGAAWQPDDGWIVFAVLFLVVRGFAKLGAAALAARLHGQLPTLGARWGWGLMGHGGLAVAVALNYRLFDPSPLAGLVFTATLVSVLVTDVLSAWMVHTLVHGATDSGAGGGGPAEAGPAEAASASASGPGSALPTAREPSA
jgi:Kef-type K+ transport system membrane component KefB